MKKAIVSVFVLMFSAVVFAGCAPTTTQENKPAAPAVVATPEAAVVTSDAKETCEAKAVKCVAKKAVVKSKKTMKKPAK